MCVCVCVRMYVVYVCVCVVNFAAEVPLEQVGKRQRRTGRKVYDEIRDLLINICNKNHMAMNLGKQTTSIRRQT